MKFLLIICAFLFSSKVFADEWTGRDKELHFLGGLGVSTVITAATKDETIGFWSGAAVGLAKEIYDYKVGGDASTKDFLVTVLGSFLGAKITGLYINSNGVFYTKKWDF